MMWSNGDLLQAGKYRIIRQIGGGGFGLTYLAEDCFLDRQVVIKVPNQQFQADQKYQKFIRRFQREGQVLAKISHPNIVQVIEFFQEAGIPCLVMAYVDGETLNQRIRHQGRLSETEAVQYFRKLTAALQIVHQADIFHCDIHPGNIMLRRQSNEPVLIDFGSVKFLQPTTITVTTTVNDFAPYEQRQDGKRQPTLDIYSLATTLYFAVTGEKPQAAIDRKLYGDTINPPQKHYPELSNWLNQAILKGMVLEPEDRPQSMQEWLGLLHPPQPTQRQSKPSQSSSQPQQKKQKNQHHYSTLPFVRLSFLLLSFMSMGTLLGLITAGAGVGVVAVVGAWAVVVAWAVTVAVVVVVAVAVAGTWAVAVAVAVVVAWAWSWSWAVAVAVVVVVAWAGAWAFESLKKHYNSRSIFLILGTTSTLGLILGGVLGWFLKLQGVSLQS